MISRSKPLQVASGSIRAPRTSGFPDDIRVIGFDNIPESGYSIPTLSSMDSNSKSFVAAKAIDLITARIEDPTRPASTLQSSPNMGIVIH